MENDLWETQLRVSRGGFVQLWAEAGVSCFNYQIVVGASSLPWDQILVLESLAKVLRLNHEEGIEDQFSAWNIRTIVASWD